MRRSLFHICVDGMECDMEEYYTIDTHIFTAIENMADSGVWRLDYLPFAMFFLARVVSASFETFI